MNILFVALSFTVLHCCIETTELSFYLAITFLFFIQWQIWASIHNNVKLLSLGKMWSRHVLYTFCVMLLYSFFGTKFWKRLINFFFPLSATSNSTFEGLDNQDGGVCKIKSMKLVLRVGQSEYHPYLHLHRWRSLLPSQSFMSLVL